MTPQPRTTTTGQSAHVLTVDEAAQLLRISRGLAFQAVHTGALPHLRIGRRILIPRAALHTLIGIPTAADQATPNGGHPADAADPNPETPSTASDTAAPTTNTGELHDLALRLQAIIDAQLPLPDPLRRTVNPR